MCGSKASLLRAADTFRVKWSERVHLVGYVAELHWPRRPGKTLYREARSVALQLCPPLQFGPLTYQPIECVFTSSNQSALWSCLPYVTSQLGGAVVWVLFVSFSWSCGRLVYETVLERFPQWVFRGFKEVWSMFETFLGQSMCSYVGELESLGQGWKHKPRAQIKSWKKDSSKKNDPVGRRSDAMIFDLLR